MRAIKWLVVSATLGAWCGQVTAGGISAVLFDENSGLTAVNFSQSVGWQFNVTDQISVNGLQWFDDGADGLSTEHEVGIWSPAGDLLASVVIPAGTGADLVDGIWRTIEISAIVLEPGEGYTVGGYNGAFSLDRLAYGVDQELHAAITYVAGTYSGMNGLFELPTTLSAGQPGLYGPGFQLLPAPGTGVLLLIGALTGLSRRRRRQQPLH
ncbi:MAG: DUF4082 domain-containing protein [Planctomycetota bacterium]|jgi:hypothetical protein